MVRIVLYRIVSYQPEYLVVADTVTPLNLKELLSATRRGSAGAPLYLWFSHRRRCAVDLRTARWRPSGVMENVLSFNNPGKPLHTPH